jgi:hypothetical protein
MLRQITACVTLIGESRLSQALAPLVRDCATIARAKGGG